MQRPSEAPQTPPPTARLLVNVYNLSGEKLITFSQNVSLEGKDKWEELSIGLTAKEAVQVEISCENASNISVFFDNLSVKVQAVPTVLVVQENHYYPPFVVELKRFSLRHFTFQISDLRGGCISKGIISFLSLLKKKCTNFGFIK